MRGKGVEEGQELDDSVGGDAIRSTLTLSVAIVYALK